MIISHSVLLLRELHAQILDIQEPLQKAEGHHHRPAGDHGRGLEDEKGARVKHPFWLAACTSGGNPIFL